jgi:hypothetical protein
MEANREPLPGNGFPGLRVERGDPDAEELAALVVVLAALAALAAREAPPDERPAWTGQGWQPETAWRFSGLWP